VLSFSTLRWLPARRGLAIWYTPPPWQLFSGSILRTLKEGLAQVEDCRGPQADEDRRLPSATCIQIEREQDGE
jgi:hypothetical protein